MAKIFKGFLCASLICAACASALSPARSQETGLPLTANDAVITALQNNRSLQIQKLAPSITGLNELKQKSAFDPKLKSSVTKTESVASGSKRHGANGSVEISKTFEQGTEISAGVTTDNSSARGENSLYSSRFVVSLSRPLFKGAGSAVNLAGLRQSELETKTAYYELQGYTESLINQVVATYWDYALAQRKQQIYEDSLKLAEQQLEKTKTMVDVGRLAEIDLVSAQAETASRKHALIDAISRQESLRIKLLGLLNPAETDFWQSKVEVKDDFVIPKVELGDLGKHIRTALDSRPDLITARLAFEKGALDVVKTKNGLLPYLSFFVTLGNTEYAKSFASSYGDVYGSNHDAQIGLNYSLNLGKRSEKASYEQSLLRNQQSGIAIENMEVSVQEDVRNAWIEIQRAESQIEATRPAVKLQEEKLKAETEKYQLGRSTAINVAMAQRDFLQSRLDEAQAIADYIMSLHGLYLKEGKLLDKYGVTVK